MQEQRRDKLGRRIPIYDRSTAGKKAVKTIKETYGKDHYAKIGATGGGSKLNRYFSKLKKENPEAFKELSQKGGEKSVATRKAKKTAKATRKSKLSISRGTS